MSLEVDCANPQCSASYDPEETGYQCPDCWTPRPDAKPVDRPIFLDCDRAVPADGTHSLYSGGGNTTKRTPKQLDWNDGTDPVVNVVLSVIEDGPRALERVSEDVVDLAVDRCCAAALVRELAPCRFDASHGLLRALTLDEPNRIAPYRERLLSALTPAVADNPSIGIFARIVTKRSLSEWSPATVTTVRRN